MIKPLPYNADLLDVASHVVWSGTSACRPVRFLTCLMTYGTIEEIVVVDRYVDPDDFRETLDHAPPGIMDDRSWAPPMPRRVIP